MASKGQKFKKYKKEETEKIIKEYFDGASPSYLSKIYNIPVKTIKNWIYKHKNPNRFLRLGQKRGRSKEKDLTKEDYKERYEILKKYQAFSRHKERKSNFYKSL